MQQFQLERMYSLLAGHASANVSVVDQSGDVATAVQEIIARASTRLDVSVAQYHYFWRKGHG